MLYEIAFTPQSLKDLHRIQSREVGVIMSKIGFMKQDLKGDVKRLKNFFPKFRLRVGVYRVLFEVEAGTIVVYRVLHRRLAYD